MIQNQSQAKGYLTVFLSMTITIMLSLILTLFQGARIGAMKMKTEIITDVSMNSVLSEYSRQLYEQYGLLMVDTSYGTSNPGIINAQEHLRYYINGNVKKSVIGSFSGATQINRMFLKTANITGSSFAADNKGAVLRRQILSYMEADPIEGGISDALDNLNILQSNHFDTRDIEAEQRANQESINDILAENDSASDSLSESEDDGETEDIQYSNPADQVNSMRSADLLGLVIGESRVSGASVNTDDYLSHRKLNHGTGLNNSEDTGITEKLLIDEYIFEKCGNYRNQLDKSVLKYQVEYLLGGKDNDKDNLQKVATTLLFWREASNYIYILTDSEKVEFANGIALVVSVLARCPQLQEPVKQSILFAWSFAESISDLHILFDGGRVPIVKSKDTWKLSYESMFSLGNSISGSDGSKGLTYEDYLRMMLFVEGGKKKSFRLMDIMEMDIRKTKGNINFKMDYCLDEFCAKIQMGDKSGFTADIERIYGYER